jgi:hypothetical protein
VKGLYQQCCSKPVSACCGRLTRSGDCCGEPEAVCCEEFVYVGPDGLTVDPVLVSFTGCYLEGVAE